MTILFIITLILVVANGYVINYKSISPVIVYDYHRTTGIPMAEKIMKYEKEMSIQRIIGGSSIEISTVPYQAGLVVSVYETSSVCGGSVVSNTRILTAAHCYSDGISTAQIVTVVLGSSQLFSGGTRIQTSDVVVHSGFNPYTVENDIAMIRVSSVTFTSQIQPIGIPSGAEVNMDFTGYQAVASGYGMTSVVESITLLQTLSSVTVPVISNAECMHVYGFITNQHLCTSGVGVKGTCGGDSGGPLTVEISSKNILIGITSFGAEDCTESYPSAYVRVTEFLDWISTELS